VTNVKTSSYRNENVVIEWICDVALQPMKYQ